MKYYGSNKDPSWLYGCFMWHSNGRAMAVPFLLCNSPLVWANNDIFLRCLNKFSCFPKKEND